MHLADVTLANSERRLVPAAFFPGIVSERFYPTWEFYTELLGFRTASEWDTYLELVHPTGARLAVIKAETDGQPSDLISPPDGRGFWLNLEVADAETEFIRLCAAGVKVVSEVETKPWGCRQFMIRDPNGVLICLTQPAAW